MQSMTPHTNKNPLQGMRRHPVLQLAYVLLFNTAIALLLTLLIQGAWFWQTLVVSHCIGLSLFASFYAFSHFAALKGWMLVIPMVIGAVCGVLLGMLAAMLMNGMQLSDVERLVFSNYEKLLVNLFLAFFFGIIVMYFFFSREQRFQARQDLQEVQIRHLDQKKQLAETQLQLLQAQIEPHFLFNSLSNVISLIEHDPARARLMLESLTRYLRSSLSRSHDKDGALRDELDLIENYLKIIQIRMGGRLQYRIEVDEALRARPFPIMLLQPLVENAILHGLEPKAEGGEIVIQARLEEDALHIRVSDNGVGLPAGDLKGFGLMNVRQRLHSLFGAAARLKLENNPPQGVCASVVIPCA